jgi:hypothetical protein
LIELVRFGLIELVKFGLIDEVNLGFLLLGIFIIIHGLNVCLKMVHNGPGINPGVRQSTYLSFGFTMTIFFASNPSLTKSSGVSCSGIPSNIKRAFACSNALSKESPKPIAE